MTVHVLGMHRSGTSALARAIGLLVGWRGNEGADPVSNPRGHWEDGRVLDALDRALLAQGGDWASPVVAAPDAFPDDCDAEAVLSKVLNEHGTDEWVLKDPRLCLFLDPLLRLPQPAAVLVAVVRHPLGVARSLARRDGLPLDYGLALWEVYNRRLLASLQRATLPTTWISYERLVAGPSDTLQKLAVELAGAGVSTRPGALPAAVGSVDRRVPEEESPRDLARVSEQQRALLGLLEEAGRIGVTPAGPPPALTPWARSMLEVRRPFVTMDHRNRVLEHRMRRLAPLFGARERWRRGTQRLRDSLRR